MQTVPLPSGEKVPALGMGTWMLGDNRARRAEEIATLQRGIDLGMTLIDTAEMYGEGASEKLVGEAIKGRRSEVFLVSKVYPHNAGGRALMTACERSLQRLETDFIDLVLVHSDGNDLAILNESQVYETLAELKREGKIRGFGLSGKTVEGGLKALETGDCAMVTYNLNEQAERPVIDYAAAHGKAILVKKALASGHVCLSPGVDPVRASFELVFGHPGVASAIVGTINPLHLAHNVATVAQVLRKT